MNEVLKGLINLLGEKGFEVREIGEMKWKPDDLCNYSAIKIIVTPKGQEPRLI